MAEDQNLAAAVSQDAQRQVRVQLTSKQEEIALPENTGPILVPTGELPASNFNTGHRLILALRSAAICAVYTGEQPPWKRQAGPVRIPDQWIFPPDFHRRILDCERHFR